MLPVGCGDDKKKKENIHLFEQALFEKVVSDASYFLCCLQ